MPPTQKDRADEARSHSRDISRSALDDTARLLEVERGNWWQAIDVLLKAMAVYLAILAALIGYILTTDLPASIQRLLLMSAILISLTYAACNAFALRLLMLQMLLIHKLSATLAAAADAESEARKIYATRRRFAAVGAVACFTVGALFVAVLLFLWFQAPGHTGTVP